MEIFFGLDTFSFGILGAFSDESWKNIISDIFDYVNIFVTHEVQIEIEYHHSRYLDWLSKITIRPRLNRNFELYLNLGFDSADASLLEISDFEKNVVIITEDMDMLDQGVTKRKNIIKLADFFALLYSNDFFTKKEFKLLINRLYEMRKVSKSKRKKLFENY